MSVKNLARTLAFAVAVSASSSALAQQQPCGHPQSTPTASAQVKIEAWKEPLLVEEFKKFGRAGDYKFFDGPLYVPVKGQPERPKIFKAWQLTKHFENPSQFVILDVSNSPGDGVYTLQLFNCAKSLAWEPIWKELMQVVDSKVVVERVK